MRPRTRCPKASCDMGQGVRSKFGWHGCGGLGVCIGIEGNERKIVRLRFEVWLWFVIGKIRRVR